MKKQVEPPRLRWPYAMAISLVLGGGIVMGIARTGVAIERWADEPDVHMSEAQMIEAIVACLVEMAKPEMNPPAVVQPQTYEISSELRVYGKLVVYGKSGATLTIDPDAAPGEQWYDGAMIHERGSNSTQWKRQPGALTKR